MSFSRGNAEELLAYGLAAAQSGDEKDYSQAEYYLEWVLRTDADLDQQATAWYWLSRISNDPERKRECLENVLAIHPSHPDARRDKAIMEGRLNPSTMRANPLEQGAPVVQSPRVAPDATQRFKCPKCGAVAQFDPLSGRLRCQFCGAQLDEQGQPIDESMEGAPDVPSGVSEQDWVAAIYTETGHRWALPQSRVLECQGCGATVTFAPALVSASCAYCGSPYVARPAGSEVADLREPDGIIPFAFDAGGASYYAHWWLGEQARRFGIPDDLPGLAALGAPVPLYVPLWTFDITGEVIWRGFVRADMDVGGVSMDGIDNAAHMGGLALGLLAGNIELAARGAGEMAARRIDGNNMVYTSGAAGVVLDDAQVVGTKSLPPEMAGKLKFTTSAVQPYREEFLAHWPAEVYSVSLSDASLVAREAAVAEGDKQIALAVGQFGDAPSGSLSIDRSGLAVMSYKLLLAPVYTVTYTYKGERYRLLVNGQTGETTGDIPRNPNPIDRLFGR
ncbi:MAG TPA: TFIIB-type zinc ribbon-containing protein [Chloroflexia bacterium]|nr:TFIIB-type zinc ribbon-containing protein [Chloroflexia bacterium]